MKLISIIILMVVLTSITQAIPSVASIPTFDQWIQQQSTSYATDTEQNYRRQVFSQNVAKINSHNADPKQTFTMGVNQFSAMTQQQFVSQCLSSVPVKSSRRLLQTLSNTTNISIDWVAAGKVTPVKNAGSTCGCGWAFASIAAVESAQLLKGVTYNLSQQQLLDCSGSYGNYGCLGGNLYNAFAFILGKGITTRLLYPFLGTTASCKVVLNLFRLKTYAMAPNSCAGLTMALAYQPIAVNVDATAWAPYTGGIVNSCSDNNVTTSIDLNHALLLVGQTNDYWTLKNSWGTQWGEQGFIRLAPGNTCGLCLSATFPTV